jgi:hypothetical protein
MKRYFPLVGLFAAGVAASLALAAPPPGHGPPTSSITTSTSPGKSGSHAPKGKCRPLNLKGTVSAGSIALQVTKAAGPKAKQLLNTTANLTVNGPVSVQAWACATADGAPTQALVLRQLRVGGSPHLPASTTTTTTTP